MATCTRARGPDGPGRRREAHSCAIGPRAEHPLVSPRCPCRGTQTRSERSGQGRDAGVAEVASPQERHAQAGDERQSGPFAEITRQVTSQDERPAQAEDERRRDPFAEITPSASEQPHSVIVPLKAGRGGDRRNFMVLWIKPAHQTWQPAEA